MEEGLLPKNTKVVITGNNRTKSFLVGLHAVVKNTAGVRGWHWLVLPNGLEVKLQRNALSVIEMPTGQEEGKQEQNQISNSTSSLDLDFQPKAGACRDQAIEQEDKQDGNLSSNNSSSSSFDLVSDEFQKICKPKSRSCVLEGSSSRNHGRQVQSRESNFPSHRMLKVDLRKLETSALWRYWKHFNLVDVGPNSSKDQLVGAVERHFISQQLDELQVISGFVQAAKRLKTVCS